MAMPKPKPKARPKTPAPRHVRVAAMASRMKERAEARMMAGLDREGALDRAWKLDSAFNLGERMLAKIQAWAVPVFTGEITVSVAGGPHADVKRVWYLALSAAFGRLRNTFGAGDKLGNFVTHEMAGLWDVTRKVCQVEIAYALTAFDNVFIGAPEVPPPDLPGTRPVMVGGVRVTGRVNPTRRPGDYIKRGPEQLTIGGSWPDWLRRAAPPAGFGAPETWVGAACDPPGTPGLRRTVTAVPRNFRDVFREYPVPGANGLFGFYPHTVIHPPGTAVSAPGSFLSGGGEFVLPDASRVITTGEKADPRVQPPAPILDGRGRSNLVGLVAQSLQAPCFLPTGVGCSPVPNGDPGVYIANRDADLGPLNVAAAIVGRRLTTPVDVLPGSGADGSAASVTTATPAPDFRR